MCFQRQRQYPDEIAPGIPELLFAHALGANPFELSVHRGDRVVDVRRINTGAHDPE
ncbi:hypothetical protein D3C83_178150 [compost metagenome]